MDKSTSYDGFFAMLRSRLGERAFRLTSGALAKMRPRGGVSLVANASGLSRPTVYSGIRELEQEVPAPFDPERQRRSGGGRKALEARDATLERDLRGLVSPRQRGDPEPPLTWTSKSLRKLAAELGNSGRSFGHVTVGRFRSAQHSFASF